MQEKLDKQYARTKLEGLVPKQFKRKLLDMFRVGTLACCVMCVPHMLVQCMMYVSCR